MYSFVVSKNGICEYKKKNSWGISGIFYKLIPFLLLIFGGLFVFGHIMGILRAEFATIGGFLMGDRRDN